MKSLVWIIFYGAICGLSFLALQELSENPVTNTGTQPMHRIR